MDYFSIDTRPTEDPSLCVLRTTPEGTANYAHRMARGFPMGADYPADAKWYMSDKSPGIKLASLVAAMPAILVVHRDLKEVLEATGAPMECLPFTLYNHKKRVASRDYFIVNPLAVVNCLNLQKSEVSWSEDGQDILQIYEPVLDPAKLPDVPPVFRIQEDRQCIVLGDGVVARLNALAPTNVYLTRLRQEA
jgi:hypothetical protein